MAGLTAAQRRRIERYERDNRECAAIILADIAKYGGEECFVVRWARTMQMKPEPSWPKGDLCDE